MLTWLPEWRGLPKETLSALVDQHGEYERMRGDFTRLPMPPRIAYPKDLKFLWEEDDLRSTFFYWCKEEDVWTLSYTLETFEACMSLCEDLPNLWMEVKEEIFPSQANELCHRKHGTSGLYGNTGCRGPLCSAANRVKARKRIDADPSSRYVEVDDKLMVIGESFRNYLRYIQIIKNSRALQDRRIRKNPAHWVHVDLRTTLLLEVTSA